MSATAVFRLNSLLRKYLFSFLTRGESPVANGLYDFPLCLVLSYTALERPPHLQVQSHSEVLRVRAPTIEFWTDTSQFSP